MAERPDLMETFTRQRERALEDMLTITRKARTELVNRPIDARKMTAEERRQRFDVFLADDTAILAELDYQGRRLPQERPIPRAVVDYVLAGLREAEEGTG